MGRPEEFFETLPRKLLYIALALIAALVIAQTAMRKGRIMERAEIEEEAALLKEKISELSAEVADLRKKNNELRWRRLFACGDS